MKRSHKIKNGLEKVGKKMILGDGEWKSAPFYGVLDKKWKSNKSDFEFHETEIGKVSADYYTYIGPYNHDILALSENACLYADGEKYIFKRRAAEKMNDEIIYYSGVVRKVWEDPDDQD